VRNGRNKQGDFCEKQFENPLDFLCNGGDTGVAGDRRSRSRITRSGGRLQVHRAPRHSPGDASDGHAPGPRPTEYYLIVVKQFQQQVLSTPMPMTTAGRRTVQGRFTSRRSPSRPRPTCRPASMLERGDGGAVCPPGIGPRRKISAAKSFVKVRSLSRGRKRSHRDPRPHHHLCRKKSGNLNRAQCSPARPTSR